MRVRRFLVHAALRVAIARDADGQGVGCGVGGEHAPGAQEFGCFGAAVRDGAGRIAEPFDVEAGNLFLEPAFAEQNIIVRNAAIFEEKRTPLFATHESRRLADGEPRRAAFHDNGPYAADARPEADIDEKHLGFGTVGREDFSAVEDNAAAVPAGGGAQIRDGRTGVRLGHAEADKRSSRKKTGQKPKWTDIESVRAQVGGSILSLTVDKGQVVSAGQVLAKISARDLDEDRDFAARTGNAGCSARREADETKH